METPVKKLGFAIKTPSNHYLTDKGDGFWGLTETPDTIFETAEIAEAFIKKNLSLSAYWKIESVEKN